MFVVSELLFAVAAVIVGGLVFVVAVTAAAAAVTHDVMRIASDDSVIDVAFSGIYNFVLRLAYILLGLSLLLFPDYKFII